MNIDLLFYKKNKKFVCFLESTDSFIDNPNFLIKSVLVDDEEFNLARYRWEGDFENGRLIDLFKEKKSVVTEKEINQKYEALLSRKYSILDIVLSSQSDDQLAMEIKQFIKKLWDKKQKEIEMYRNSDYHIFESIEQQIKREKEIFE